jgi:hypothetical protein
VQKGNIVTDKFRVGQRVRAKIDAHVEPEAHGKVFVITAPREWVQARDWKGSTGYQFSYTLDDGCVAEEHHLEAVYDGDEKSSWSECAWKPQAEPVRPVAETK